MQCGSIAFRRDNDPHVQDRGSYLNLINFYPPNVSPFCAKGHGVTIESRIVTADGTVIGRCGGLNMIGGRFTPARVKYCQAAITSGHVQSEYNSCWLVNSWDERIVSVKLARATPVVYRTLDQVRLLMGGVCVGGPLADHWRHYDALFSEEKSRRLMDKDEIERPQDILARCAAFIS